MDDWNEVRTALEVARRGTLSRAAEALGVHRATVLRRVDSLEGKLGSKLFVRHARGYAVTDVGEEFLHVAGDVEERLGGFFGQAQRLATAFSGELTVTSIDEVAPWLLPAMIAFREAYPAVRLRYVASTRLFRLEGIDAHVAVRLGRKPVEPDHVVLPFATMRFALYAHRRYVARHGMPAGENDLAGHFFVGSDDPEVRAPFDRWLRSRVPDVQIIFHTTSERVRAEAIQAGTGMGFLLQAYARAQPDLVEVLPPREEWEVPMWIVTHADLHRAPKVRAFVELLKGSAATAGPALQR
ncbi:MAG: LysR family transcriptional regulator [Myxococcota bacterium]